MNEKNKWEVLSKQPNFYKEPLSKISADLSKVSEDLTYLASEGKIEEIYERDNETQRMIEILGLKQAANPMIIGESGVGKTALAKNLARLIAENKVPHWLKGWKVVLTSFGMMWAEAGSQARGGDAWDKYFPLLRAVINTCKEYPIILFMDEMQTIVRHPISRDNINPPLADGSLRLIGAMTQRDYRRIIETDEVLNRRFQPVYLEPLSSKPTLKILRRLKKTFAGYYDIEIFDEVLKEVVDLSDLYIHNRYNPAKAINVLERACVRAAMAGQKQLDSKFVKQVITDITKVPDNTQTTEKERYNGIADFLNQRVLGQEDIIAKIAKRLLITLTRSNVEPHRPNGVFFFAGPTGVGKTELAKALSSCLTGSDENMVRLDMSLYAGPDARFDLLGTQRAGRDEPGIPFLTNIIRSHPYTVLLLDEFEKAHPVIWNLFLQVFDYGVLRDLEGNDIYFDNTMIIMTTNVGFKHSGIISIIPAEDQARQREQVLQAIREIFPRELLGRVDEILIFNSLTPELMERFVDQKVALLQEKIGRTINLKDEVKKFLAKKGYDETYGARALNRTIDRYLGTLIAELKLGDKWDKITEITVGLNSQLTDLEVKNLKLVKGGKDAIC